jgi:hypothetical protein
MVAGVEQLIITRAVRERGYGTGLAFEATKTGFSVGFS